MLKYKIIDQFILYAHLIIVIINSFFWIFKKTRKIHLIVFSFTTLSWFGLGLFYGIGYCPITDYHWHIRNKLGHFDMPDSYIKFILDYFLGTDLNVDTVNTGIFYGYYTILFFTLVLNSYDFYKFKKLSKETKN